MLNKLFSIITPIYRPNFDYFKECIESVRSQTYKNFEWLIIDDGDDIETNKKIIYLLDNYNDSRFKYFTISHSGQSKARNVGLDNAKGEYIIFLDSDDRLSNIFLESAFKQIDNADVILFGDTNSLNNLSKKIKNIQCNIKGYDNICDLYFLNKNKQYLSGQLKSAWGKAFKKSCIRFNECHQWPGEDTLFVLEILSHSNNVICSAANILYFYRENLDSISHVNSESCYKNYNELFSLLFEFASRQINKEEWFNYFNIQIVDIYIYNYFKQCVFIKDFANKYVRFKEFLNNKYVKYAIKKTKLKNLCGLKKYALWLLKSHFHHISYFLLNRRYCK